MAIFKLEPLAAKLPTKQHCTRSWTSPALTAANYKWFQNINIITIDSWWNIFLSWNVSMFLKVPGVDIYCSIYHINIFVNFFIVAANFYLLNLLNFWFWYFFTNRDLNMYFMEIRSNWWVKYLALISILMVSTFVNISLRNFISSWRIRKYCLQTGCYFLSNISKK